jgi:hypothetical protein
MNGRVRASFRTEWKPTADQTQLALSSEYIDEIPSLTGQAKAVSKVPAIRIVENPWKFPQSVFAKSSGSAGEQTLALNQDILIWNLSARLGLR